MAAQDANGKQTYWYDGVSSTFLKTRNIAQVGGSSYWYNGQPQGYLVSSVYVAKPRYFSVLIGF